MIRPLLVSGFAIAAIGGLTVWRNLTPVSATPVPERIAALQKVIRPCEDEDAFDKIAWLTTIHDARVKAAKEGKPILLWEMDGHPLGCG